MQSMSISMRSSWSVSRAEQARSLMEFGDVDWLAGFGWMDGWMDKSLLELGMMRMGVGGLWL